MWKQIKKHLKFFLYAIFFFVICSYRFYSEVKDVDYIDRNSIEINTGRYEVENTLEKDKNVPVKSVTKSISDRGKLADISDHLLVVNRIPDTGSEVFILLLQWLQGLNNFAHERLDGYNLFNDRSIVNYVLEKEKTRATPVTFDFSHPFVNFSKYGEQSPTYFTVLRDPLTILESRYYANILKRKAENDDIESIQSFEDCWLSNEPECAFENGGEYKLPVSYICGDADDGECAKLNSEEAAARAKENADRFYPVLGLLENLNDTLQVLEHSLPRFFRRAFQLYRKRLAGMRPSWNSSPYVSSLVETEMKNAFEKEYEFYDWAKARLYEQTRMLRTRPTKDPIHFSNYD